MIRSKVVINWDPAFNDIDGMSDLQLLSFANG